MLLFCVFCGIIAKNTERQVSFMEEQILNETPEQLPRKRRKTKEEILKQTYLPYMFLLGAAILIVIFIIGALVRG